jgi:sporulation protein YlmC with PRC-barrel domain
VLAEVSSMKIPLNAKVQCTDGPDGRTVQVVVDPVSKRTTHVVVEQEKPPSIERLVPRRLVLGTIDNAIYLNCSREELGKMTPLIEAEFLWAEIPGFNEIHPYLLHPFVIPGRLMVRQESLPPEELGVRRGARVQATDGKVGRVDEFVVIPTNGEITHLLLREGHLWGSREVSIPISAIERIDGKIVHLWLNKREIRALPSVPVRRPWL